jgi:hypothetical protein
MVAGLSHDGLLVVGARRTPMGPLLLLELFGGSRA